MAGPDSSGNCGRFCLRKTQLIGQYLSKCIADEQAPKELQALCSHYKDEDLIPWRIVSSLCDPYSGKGSDQGSPELRDLCSGSSISFPTPAPRQRSAALEKRLAELQAALDSKQYAAMVADITQQERASVEQEQDNFFPTTKLQLSFGLHVVVTMGTFFALAYYAVKLAYKSEAWAAAGGAVGMTIGMLLETTLLIVRMNMPPSLDQKYGHLMDKRYDKPNFNPGAAAVRQQEGKEQAAGKQGQGRSRQPAADRSLATREKKKQ